MRKVTADDAGVWANVRASLNLNRHGLAARAARLYPGVPRVGSTPLLCRPEWIPRRPVPLGSIALHLIDDVPPPPVTGHEEASATVRPARPGGGRFASYSAAMAALAAPSVFEDRCSYRLLAADLGGSVAALRIGMTTYFAGVDIKEALAHELAAATGDHRAGDHRAGEPAMADLPLRSLVGDPCDLARHTAVPAVTTVTIRHDRQAGTADFLLHWRDPAKVAHGGGLFQVLPVGVFQPITGSAADVRRDLDLWRCVAREYSEELLGTSEDYGPGFRYDTWPFFRRLEELAAAGALTVHCLGLGVDPLSLAVDLLAVAVFEATAFDELFADLIAANAEGVVERLPLAEAGPFITGARPMQAAGAAALYLVRRHFADAAGAYAPGP